MSAISGNSQPSSSSTSTHDDHIDEDDSRLPSILSHADYEAFIDDLSNLGFIEFPGNIGEISSSSSSSSSSEEQEVSHEEPKITYADVLLMPPKNPNYRGGGGRGPPPSGQHSGQTKNNQENDFYDDSVLVLDSVERNGLKILHDALLEGDDRLMEEICFHFDIHEIMQRECSFEKDTQKVKSQLFAHISELMKQYEFIEDETSPKTADKYSTVTFEKDTQKAKSHVFTDISELMNQYEFIEEETSLKTADKYSTVTFEKDTQKAKSQFLTDISELKKLCQEFIEVTSLETADKYSTVTFEKDTQKAESRVFTDISELKKQYHVCIEETDEYPSSWNAAEKTPQIESNYISCLNKDCYKCFPFMDMNNPRRMCNIGNGSLILTVGDYRAVREMTKAEASATTSGNN